ncbi:hypothetical protein MOC17_16095 [Bacillus haynesii]|uniref:hypothetical protein n=1 Tax=Bacillus haynesii TaxID=1925021 RepID=UPI00227E03E0|nr:hypothetical protein [Bacillus haynesii]MCY8047590.1 hypothetical protein [Bacillus haynesii]
MMTKKEQEKALFLLDELIDAGVDVSKLRKELSDREEYNYGSVKQHLRRGFGSIRKALEAYGIYDQICEPNQLELQRCFYVSEDYRVLENKYKSEELKELYNISNTQFREYKRSIIDQLEKEALERYVKNTFPEGLRREYIREKQLKHIDNYLRKYFSGSAKKLCEEWGFSYEIFNYSFRSAHPNCNFYLQKGFEFEGLVGEALRCLYPNSVQEQKIVGKCRPDFVVGGNVWIDAKLSKDTVYSPGVKTIQKYRKYTNNLIIIYARDIEGVKDSEGVTFVSGDQLISELRKVDCHVLADKIKKFLGDLNTQINKMNEGVDAA